MVAIPSRHKSLVLLAGVIVLQVLMLAVQIKRDSEGRLIRVWTVGAVSPFERAGSSGFGWFRDTWRHYFALQNTTRENEQIRHENDAPETANLAASGQSRGGRPPGGIAEFPPIAREGPP